MRVVRCCDLHVVNPQHPGKGRFRCPACGQTGSCRTCPRCGAGCTPF